MPGSDELRGICRGCGEYEDECSCEMSKLRAEKDQWEKEAREMNFYGVGLPFDRAGRDFRRSHAGRRHKTVDEFVLWLIRRAEAAEKALQEGAEK